jgi:hypothetical protein
LREKGDDDNMLAQSFYRGFGATEDPERRRWIMPVEYAE